MTGKDRICSRLKEIGETWQFTVMQFNDTRLVPKPEMIKRHSWQLVSLNQVLCSEWQCAIALVSLLGGLKRCM